MKSSKISKPLYWTELDGLRSIAFFLVFLSHCPPASSSELSSILNKYCAWGWVGVDLFFVLSGFLISYLLIKEKFSCGKIAIVMFYKRRALRIWPLYFSLLAVIGLYPLLSHHWNGQYRVFLQEVILPFFVFAGNYTMIWRFGIFSDFCHHWNIAFTLYVGLLVPLWSLCIEEQFYLFWPRLLNLANTIKGICFGISLLYIASIFLRFLLVVAAIKNGYSHSFYYMDSFCHLDALMIGAAIAVGEYARPGWLTKYVQGYRGWITFGILTSILISIPSVVPSIYDRKISIAPTMTVISLSFGALLLLSMSWKPLRTVLQSRLLLSIGKVSYAMYLFHLFIIRSIESRFPPITSDPTTDWVIRLSLSILLTWVAAQISWHLIEKRFLAARAHFNPTDTGMSYVTSAITDTSSERLEIPFVLRR